jgi:RND superfamily putative drug exporter
VKHFGVGLAVAVALAASMVLLLAPALLVLMGRATWWLPRWLGKILPHMDIEGEAFREGAPKPDADAEPAVTRTGAS